MTLSRSETILAGVVTILEGALTGDAAATVYRDRAEALARNEMPAVGVDWASQTDQVTTHKTLTTTMALDVAVFISGTPITLLADPIWVAAHAAMMNEATGAPSLAGVISIAPQGRTVQNVSGEIGMVECRYSVNYQTYQLDLTDGLT